MKLEYEAELLMPWLHNGSLQGDEQQLAMHFEQEQNELAAAEKRLDEELRHIVKQQAGGSPAEFGWARLQRDLFHTTTEKSPAKNNTKWIKFALAASLILIVIESGFLLQTLPELVRYEPLGQQQVSSAVLQIEFQPDATEKNIRDLLNQVKGRVIDGPGAMGIYRVALDLSAENEGGIDDRIKILADQSLIVRHVSRD